MPTQGSGSISIDELSNFMGGGRPDGANEYNGLDGSWSRGAITGAWSSYYARPQGTFAPAPGSERITFWFWDGARWNMRFNPTVSAQGAGSVVYYVQSSGTSPVTPSQFNFASNQFSITVKNQWKQINRFYQGGDQGGGIRYYRIQAHNGVSGYRALLPYYWNAST